MTVVSNKKNLKDKLRSFTSDQLFSWLAWIVAIATAIICTVFVTYFISFNSGFSEKQEIWGAFGDFIGGTLNPILSFFALIALLLTITLQSRELEATREELKRSSSAQEASEKALKKQSEILNRQQFEQTFFSLLEQHNTVLEKLTRVSDRWTAGRSDLDMVRVGVFNASSLMDAKKILQQKNGMCGHYFRILYQLLKFVSTNIPGSEIGPGFDQSDIKNKPLAYGEKMYSNMVRSFLDYDTAQVLAINCFCKDESDTYWSYKLLLERYEFLEHMPFRISQEVNTLLQETTKFYSPSAFGNSNFIHTIHENT